MNAAEKMRMDAILNNIGPPPDWFNDILYDDGVVKADDELHSPDGIEMHRPMPGSSDFRMLLVYPMLPNMLLLMQQQLPGVERISPLPVIRESGLL